MGSIQNLLNRILFIILSYRIGNISNIKMCIKMQTHVYKNVRCVKTFYSTFLKPDTNYSLKGLK